MTSPIPDPLQLQLLTALEAERHLMANMLEESVISSLNLLLAQAVAYEQSLTNQQAQMAVAVLSVLIRQTLQQTHDLESRLHPLLLYNVGLHAALEQLASQEQQVRGLHISLSLQKLKERIPNPIEIILFRTTQQAIDRAFHEGNASVILIELQYFENILTYHISDNGRQANNPPLTAMTDMIENLGGMVTIMHSKYGGVAYHARFKLDTAIDLTARELELIPHLAAGLSNKQIAAELKVSPRTIKFHLDNIYSKIGVNTRTEVVVYGIRHGWISNPRLLDRD